MWQNSMTKNVTKLKTNQIATKRISLNGDKTHKLELWQNSKTKAVKNSKTQIVTKLKNSNFYKTQKM